MDSSFIASFFFEITFTSIVNQGIFGGGKIVKYLNFIGSGLAFHVVKGCYKLTIVPITEKRQKINDKIIDTQAKKFYLRLIKNKFPTPSLIKLFLFRLAKASMQEMLNENNRDYAFYMKRPKGRGINLKIN